MSDFLASVERRAFKQAVYAVQDEEAALDIVQDSMLKLAECRLKLKGPREARATWEKIISGYPGTTAATQAQARLHSSQTSTASP